MNHFYAVMVDAGYLVASMAKTLTGSSNRNMIQVQWEKLVQQMKQEISQIQEQQSAGSELLRVQWYDSPPEEHEGRRAAEEAFFVIDGISRTKTRIGRTSFGNQKGVDVKLALDIVHMSMRGLVRDIYLVSGDDDLTEAVEIAQDYGVRVHLYNVGASPESAATAKFGLYSTATNLARRVDERHVISSELVKRVASIAPISLEEESGVSRAKGFARVAGAPGATPGTLSSQTGESTSSSLVSDSLSSGEKKDDAEGTKTTPTPRGVPIKKQSIAFRPPVQGARYDDFVKQNQEATVQAIKLVVAQTVLSLKKTGRLNTLARNYSRPVVPPDIDRALLIDVCLALGDPDTYLASQDREYMRSVLWDEIEREMG